MIPRTFHSVQLLTYIVPDQTEDFLTEGFLTKRIDRSNKNIRSENGGLIEAISIHVPIPQQNAGENTSVPLHCHPSYLSRRGNNFQPSGHRSPLPCHGKGDGGSVWEGKVPWSCWRLWLQTAFRWEGKDSHHEGSARDRQYRTIEAFA